MATKLRQKNSDFAHLHHTSFIVNPLVLFPFLDSVFRFFLSWPCVHHRCDWVFISLPFGLRVVCRHSLPLFRLGEAAEFDSENRFRVGCGEGREQEAEEELERERRNAVAMAEHGGELAAEEPMKLASGFRIESNYRACTIPYRFPSDSPRKPTPTELSCFDLFYNSTPSFK